MKKIFLLIGFIGFVGLIGSFETTYSRQTVCTNLTSEIATFTDINGNNWDWELEKGNFFQLGKNYKLIMNTNGTSSIYDDQIKKIEKNH